MPVVCGAQSGQGAHPSPCPSFSYLRNLPVLRICLPILIQVDVL